MREDMVVQEDGESRRPTETVDASSANVVLAEPSPFVH